MQLFCFLIWIWLTRSSRPFIFRNRSNQRQTVQHQQVSSGRAVVQERPWATRCRWCSVFIRPRWNIRACRTSWPEPRADPLTSNWMIHGTECVTIIHQSQGTFDFHFTLLHYVLLVNLLYFYFSGIWTAGLLLAVFLVVLVLVFKQSIWRVLSPLLRCLEEKKMTLCGKAQSQPVTIPNRHCLPLRVTMQIHYSCFCCCFSVIDRRYRKGSWETSEGIGTVYFLNQYWY